MIRKMDKMMPDGSLSSGGAVRDRLVDLHDAQERVERESCRYNVVACGRRWGKTTMGTRKLLETALDGYPAGWFAPSYKYVQEVWRDLTRKLGEAVEKANAQERRIELSGGGVIEVWSFSGDEAPGQSRAYKRVVVDEGALIAQSHDDFLRVGWQEGIRPTLSDYAGDAWFLSTPKGRGNAYYELFQRGSERDEWASWQMPTWTNPHISEEEIEALRRDMLPKRFAQEVRAKFVNVAEGALWDYDRIGRESPPEHMDRIVVGVDPAGGGPDEVGIVAVGKSGERAYVLRDASMRGSPQSWASAVASVYHDLQADRVVAERNFGGDMVKSTLQTADPNLPVDVISASRGKQQRAEPVAALYEQGRVHHPEPLETLETQMTTWDPESGDSPDRVDALVWALTELMLQNEQSWLLN